MAIVGALDIHREQLTYDWVDQQTGENRRGRVVPANREGFRRWLQSFDGAELELVVEACTGWRFIVEECRAAGVTVYLAEPADAANAMRGRKQRAKTDRLDARRLRELLEKGEVPQAWIPPTFLLEIRAKVRLYKDLLDEKAGWQQRIHATFFHQGVPKSDGKLLRRGRARAGRDDLGLSSAGRQAVDVALRMIEAIDGELVSLRAELVAFGRRHPGPVALSAEYGLGPLLATVVWEEMGDTRRFSASRQAVRHTGLDVSVYSSDGKRLGRPRITHQGPPLLRWALFEAAVHANKKTSPDHDYYTRLADRVGKGRARISVSRKLARRCHHRLRAVGDAAFTELPT